MSDSEEEGVPVEGLEGWYAYTTDEGEEYYYNSNTDETLW